MILISDEFDGIVAANEGDDGAAEEVEFTSLIEVVEFYWKKFYPGSLPTQVMIIAEAAYPQGQVLRSFSEGLTEWAMLGMMECVKMQIQATNVDEVLNSVAFSQDDEGDEEDDE